MQDLPAGHAGSAGRDGRVSAGRRGGLCRRLPAGMEGSLPVTGTVMDFDRKGQI